MSALPPLPYQTWLEQVLAHLDSSQEVLPAFQETLRAFYQALHQAVQGESAPLHRLLAQWSQQQPAEPPSSATEEIASLALLQRLQEATHATLEACLAPAEVQAWKARLAEVWPPAFAHAAQSAYAETLARLQRHWERVAEEKNRLEQAKSTFISVAAHELRTPLTLLEGYAAMLQEHLSSSKDETARTYLKGIRRGVTRMQEIINALIDLSQIYAHQFQITFQPVWLNRLLHSLAAELAPVLEERHLTIEIRPFPGSDEMFFGDPERLRQMFYNLLTNAIKFTPDGGRITVDGRLLPGFVEVTVQDTGIGIPPEEQERIFEHFSRLGNPLTHSSSKTNFKGGGPGLGLAIAKGIVEAHGGTIWAESEGYDEERCPGSTFHVLLPLRKEPPDASGMVLERYRTLAQHLKGART